MTAGNVLDFSDLMILGMAFPNILGVLLLSGKVRMLDEYTDMLVAKSRRRADDGHAAEGADNDGTRCILQEEPAWIDPKPSGNYPPLC